MRRTLTMLFALVSLLGLPWLAAAQPGPFGPFGPGGVIQQSAPAAGTQTSPQVTISPPTGSAQTILSTTLNSSVFSSRYPIHFIAHGRLSASGGAAGTLSMTMKLGTGTALTFPASALTVTAGVSNLPTTIECAGLPLALSQASAPQYSLTCELNFVETSGTLKVYRATSIVAYNSVSQLPPTVAALWQGTWSLSTAGNGLIVDDWEWAAR